MNLNNKKYYSTRIVLDDFQARTQEVDFETRTNREKLRKELDASIIPSFSPEVYKKSVQDKVAFYNIKYGIK